MNWDTRVKLITELSNKLKDEMYLFFSSVDVATLLENESMSDVRSIILSTCITVLNDSLLIACSSQRQKDEVTALMKRIIDATGQSPTWVP